MFQRGMSREVFGSCPGLDRGGREKHHIQAPQTKERVSRNQSRRTSWRRQEWGGELIAGRAVTTSHTCQPSCAQQQLEVSALPSMTSLSKVKIGLSVPTSLGVSG